MKKGYVVAFFPWLEIKRSISVGKYTLIGYKALSRKLRNRGVVSQLQNIFSGYIDNLNAFVKKNVTVNNPIIVLKNTQFSPFTQDEDNDLYHIRNLVAYSAICTNDKRKSRKGQKHVACYYNSSRFELLIQGFTMRSKGVAYRLKRRYGSDTITGLREYNRFVLPLYASYESSFHYDKCLINSFSKIMYLYKRRGKLNELLVAMDWFFNAHTDADIVNVRNELIMMATAYEILLNIPPRNKAIELMNNTKKAFDGYEGLLHDFNRKTARGEKELMIDKSWKQHWICKFYEERNRVAHSMVKPNLRWCNNRYFSHLEIADIVFDLLVRLYLKGLNLYKLSRDDKANCNALDKFLSKNNPSLEEIVEKRRRLKQGMKVLRDIRKMQKKTKL